jgi:LEA14-like dessication related protein
LNLGYRKLGVAVLLLSIVVTLESCRPYRDVEFKGVKDTRFTSFNAQGITCEFDIELFNPNIYDITLMESDVDLFMEGTRLGRVELPSSAVLSGENSTMLKLSCTADAASIPKLLGGAIGLMFKKDIVIQGKGTVTAKAFLISKTIPVSFEQRIQKEDLGF